MICGVHTMFYLPEAETGCPRPIPCATRRSALEVTAPIEDHVYGLVRRFMVPGGFEIQLYQPRHSKR